MRLRHLRFFAGVAEARNLSRAASALRVAQPALSRQIHELEQELGVLLLDRHPRGVAPTAAGEVLARGAVQLLHDIGAAIDRAERAAAGRSGRVVIGMPKVAIARGLAAALGVSLRAHPEILLVVREIDGFDVQPQLLSGELDVAVGAIYAARPGIVAEPLWEEMINRAIIPLSHPLAGRERVKAGELSELPLLLPPRGISAQFIEETVKQLRAAGMRSPLITTETGLGGVHLMIAAGRGWCGMTDTMAQSPPPGTAVPILEGVRLPVPACLAWRQNEHRQVVRTLVEHTLEFARTAVETRVRTEPTLPAESAMRAVRRREPGSVPVALELKHLDALLEVSAVLSISRAALRLGVTQPALSRQLQELERAIGFALLHRGTRGVSMTAGGTTLAGECPAILGDVERVTRETTRARRGMEGRCVVGAVGTVSMNNLLAATLAQCSARHPQLRVIIDEIPSPEQPAALREGLIDLGLMHPWPDTDDVDGFRRERVLFDHLDSALLSVSHPLAGRAKVTAADLATVPFFFIARDYHPQFYDQVMSSLAAIGLDPLIQATYEGRPTRWLMAAQGMGWCLVSRSASKAPPAGTVCIPIKGFDIPWGIDLVWRKDERSATVRAVISALRVAGEAGSVSAPRQATKRRAAR